MPSPQPDQNTSARRDQLRLAFLVLAWLVTAIVLAQAAIAGQWLFGDADIAVHGHLGNAALPLAVLSAAVAALARLPRAVTALSASTALLMIAQIGLGYSGRTSATAASLHIPLGVALVGLLVAAAVLAAASPRNHQTS